MSSGVAQAAAAGSAALADSSTQPAPDNTAAPAVPAAIPTESLNAHRADLSAAEYFDVLDECGHPTGVSKLRSLVHRDGDWHACVHIWVLHARSGMVLLQRRAACKDSFPSCWDVSCAGHLAAGETVAAAAEAELREELGLQAPDGIPFSDWCRPLCAPFPRTVVSQGGRFIDREHTHCFVVEGEWEAESMRLQEEEVERVEWTELAEFAAALQQQREGYVAVPDLELYARMVFAPLEERIKLIRTKHAADATVQQ